MDKETAAKKQRDDDQGKPGIPSELAVLPLQNLVLYPHMFPVPLVITKQHDLALVNDAVVADRIVAAVTQRDPDTEAPNPDDLYGFGTAAIIHKMWKMPDPVEALGIMIQGLSRLKLEEFTQTEPYPKARVTVLEDQAEDSVELEALASNAGKQLRKLVGLLPNLPQQEIQTAIVNVEQPGRLADLAVAGPFLNIKTEERQAILETTDVKARLEKVTVLLNKEIAVQEMGSKIQDEVQTEISKGQREFFLREQLKAIQKELGEGDERTMEIRELRERIEQVGMPEEARKAADHELDRLAKMPPAAAEYTVSRTYLDWLIELPWSATTQDNLDIAQAQKILDEDHYDLEKVKERILEYLAVGKLKRDMKGPILCFVGPPGVGKTSLGRSIARALGRKFVRISLGGMRDEAEIRGHRRTYIGALPGRIIQWLRKAESNNPVFMLDEVDKIGSDFRGDPSSALLEVLDPEQNNSFSDHYLEVPFDLSKVMFITTANLLSPIPPALQDRMEVLELPGYVAEEKVLIAQRFLFPRQLRENGLESGQVSLEEAAIMGIIRDYTREAGVRNLEREIGSICRKVARKVAEGLGEPVRVGPDDLTDYLGRPKFFSEVAERTSDPGVATGLAWTAAGGDILFVESTKMPGGKGFRLTGQLGEVMKESAQAALSFVRSRADSLGIPADTFRKSDLHLHIPAGAIPKDGPSAGVTMATSLVSLLTDRPVRSDVAMTGEITLRGKVLPVGGVKEKLLAAKRAGIKTVILPRKNENHVQEVPQHEREGLNIVYADHVDEILALALGKPRATRAGKGTQPA